MRFASASLGAVTIALALSSAAQSAPLVKTSGSCGDLGSGYCVTFTDTGAVPIVNKINFIAPRGGRALVTFQGSMLCQAPGTGGAVIDLASAIVTDKTIKPTPGRESGLRHTAVLMAANQSDSFNLASSLVFDFRNAGQQTFFFKIARLKMDAGASCFVHDGSFVVEFLPDSDFVSNSTLDTQLPCHRHSFCVSFDANTSLQAIRSIDFNAPTLGDAVVTFHGTLYCANSSTTRAGKYKFEAGIVTGSEEVSASGPGGLLLDAVLTAGTPTTPTARTVNLSSTRVFSITRAGTKNYKFVIHRNQMAATVDCLIYNATFTVRFFPAASNPVVVAGDPCATKTGYCEKFNADSTDPLASLSIKMPQDGTAIASLHGSMVCQAASATTLDNTVKTQITTRASAAVDVAAEGGLNQITSKAAGEAVTFNLASTHVVEAQANKTTTFYLASDITADPSRICYLYNAAFTVKYDR